MDQDKGDEIVERVRKVNDYIDRKYFNNKGGIMDGEITPPMSGINEQKTPSGDIEKGQKIINLMLELRKARETIESQLKEVKSQAKSKISALRTSENALLDSLEEKDQMTLFEVDPTISEEVQNIIENPII